MQKAFVAQIYVVFFIPIKESISMPSIMNAYVYQKLEYITLIIRQNMKMTDVVGQTKIIMFSII